LQTSKNLSQGLEAVCRPPVEKHCSRVSLAFLRPAGKQFSVSCYHPFAGTSMTEWHVLYCTEWCSTWYMVTMLPQMQSMFCFTLSIVPICQVCTGTVMASLQWLPVTSFIPSFVRIGSVVIKGDTQHTLSPKALSFW